MRITSLFAVFSLLIATTDKAQNADLVLMPESEDAGNHLPSERLVFAGETSLLQWIVRGDSKKSLQKPVCEVYRVTNSTAVPMGELPIPFDPTATADASVVELSTSFEAPESERPARFLLKVWNEVGGKRSLLTMLFIRALPVTSLDFLNGRIIHAVAFEPEDRTGWGAYLEKRGAVIHWSKTYPKSPGKSDLIFLRLESEPRHLPETGAVPGRVEVHFDEEALPGDADRISENPERGRVGRTRLQVLRSLETSAASQARLAALLDSTPDTP